MPTYKRDGGYRDIGCPSNAIEKGSRLFERIFGRSRKRYQSASPALLDPSIQLSISHTPIIPDPFPDTLPPDVFPTFVNYVCTYMCLWSPWTIWKPRWRCPSKRKPRIVRGNLLSMLDRTFIFFFLSFARDLVSPFSLSSSLFRIKGNRGVLKVIADSGYFHFHRNWSLDFVSKTFHLSAIMYRASWRESIDLTMNCSIGMYRRFFPFGWFAGFICFFFLGGGINGAVRIGVWV